MLVFAHDPGHGKVRLIGGREVVDPGTSARADINGDGNIGAEDSEANEVLSFARDIRDGVPWAAHILLRDGPVGPTYQERAERAKKAGASLVLCHHVNANNSSKPHGLMAFYLPSDELGSEVASVIARCAPKPLWRGGATPATSRTWPRVVGVMSCYANVGLPVVLIEWGFATNPGNAMALADLTLRPAIVACAASGIAHAMYYLHKAS